MFTYISIEEFADGVVKNNKDTNRKELIASLREALAAKKERRKMHDLRRTHLGGRQQPSQGRMCFTCTTGEADDSEDYEIE